MKMIFLFATATMLFASCDNVAGWFGNGSDSINVSTDDTTMSNRQIFRDQSITRENAYSDLFLDSASLESFISKKNISGADANAIRDFYKLRNYQFAWFTSSGVTEQARSFWHLRENDGSKKSDTTLKTQMDSLMMGDSAIVITQDSSYINTELELSTQFVSYARANSKNAFLNASNFYYAVPAKKMDAMQLADSLLNRQKDFSYYSGNKNYSALRSHLSRYYDAAKNGGWQTLTVTTVKKGSSSAAVPALKKRLAATGDYPTGDTSNLFSDSLETALKSFQQRHGLKATGSLNDSTVRALNVPAEERLQQVLVNMDRALWTTPVSDSAHIEVNIPSFMLYAYEGGKKVMEMPVIVGRQGTGTFAFNGRISEIVFNPSWNLPQSIVRDEIMPKMKNDPNYLKKEKMEIVNKNDSIPTIRQLPGEKNALGRVKFLFPNSYDIYLHDTPEKSLFNKTNRAQSHGCIRVADANKLAGYLLKDQSDWTPEKITKAMQGDKQQHVKVNNPKPVHISYNTAWVDENGQMNFREDVYGHDKNIRTRLFTSTL